MNDKKIFFVFLLVLIVVISGCVENKKVAQYTSSKIKEPKLSYNPPIYNFTPKKKYNDYEYELPLRELPENYQRDLVDKLNMKLSQKEMDTLLKNGVVIVPSREHTDRFDYSIIILGRTET